MKVKSKDYKSKRIALALAIGVNVGLMAPMAHADAPSNYENTSTTVSNPSNNIGYVVLTGQAHNVSITATSGDNNTGTIIVSSDGKATVTAQEGNNIITANKGPAIQTASGGVANIIAEKGTNAINNGNLLPNGSYAGSNPTASTVNIWSAKGNTIQKATQTSGGATLNVYTENGDNTFQGNVNSKGKDTQITTESNASYLNVVAKQGNNTFDGGLNTGDGGQTVIIAENGDNTIKGYYAPRKVGRQYVEASGTNNFTGEFSFWTGNDGIITAADSTKKYNVSDAKGQTYKELTLDHNIHVIGNTNIFNTSKNEKKPSDERAIRIQAAGDVLIEAQSANQVNGNISTYNSDKLVITSQGTNTFEGNIYFADDTMLEWIKKQAEGLQGDQKNAVLNINGKTGNTFKGTISAGTTGPNKVQGASQTLTITSEDGTNNLQGMLTVKSKDTSVTITADKSTDAAANNIGDAVSVSSGGKLKIEAKAGGNTVTGTLTATQGTNEASQPNTAENSDIVVEGQSNNITGAVDASDTGYIYLGTTNGNSLTAPITMTTNGKVAVYSTQGENTVSGTVTVGTKGQATDNSAFTVTSDQGNNNVSGAITVNGGGKTEIEAKAGSNTVGAITANDTATVNVSSNKGNTINGAINAAQGTIDFTASGDGAKNTLADTASVAIENKGTVNLTGQAGNVLNGPITNNGGTLKAEATTGNNEVNGNVTTTGAEGNSTFDAKAGKNTVAAGSTITNNTGGTTNLTGQTGNEINGAINNNGGTLGVTATTGDNAINGNVTTSGDGANSTFTATAGGNTVGENAVVKSTEKGTTNLTGNTGNTVNGTITGDGGTVAVNATGADAKNTVAATAKVNTANSGTVNLTGKAGNDIAGTVTNDGGTVGITAETGNNALSGTINTNGGTTTATATTGNNEITGAINTTAGTTNLQAPTGKNDFGAGSKVTASGTGTVTADGKTNNVAKGATVASSESGTVNITGAEGNTIAGTVQASGENAKTNITATAGNNELAGSANITADQGAIKIDATAGQNTVAEGATIAPTNKGSVSLNAEAGNEINTPLAIDGGTLNLNTNTGNNAFKQPVSATNSGAINATATGSDNVFTGPVTADKSAAITAEGNNNQFNGGVSATNKGTVTGNVNKADGKNTVGAADENSPAISATTGGQVSLGAKDGITGVTNEVNGAVDSNGAGSSVALTGKDNKFNGPITAEEGGKVSGEVTEAGGANTVAAGQDGNSVTANTGGQVALGAKDGVKDVTNTAEGKVSSTGAGSDVSLTGKNNNFKGGVEATKGGKISGVVTDADGANNVGKDAENNSVKATDGGQVSLGGADGVTGVTNTAEGNVSSTGANSDVSLKGKTNDFQGTITADQGGNVSGIVTDPNGSNTVAGQDGKAIDATNGGTVALGADKGVSGVTNTANGSVAATGDNSSVSLTGKDNKFNGPITAADKGKVSGVVTDEGGANTVAKDDQGNSVTANTGGQVALGGADGVQDVTNTAEGKVSSTGEGSDVSLKGKNNNFNGGVDADDNGKVSGVVTAPSGKNTVAAAGADGNSISATNAGQVSMGANPDITDSGNDVQGNVIANGKGQVDLNAGTGGNTIGGDVAAGAPGNEQAGGTINVGSTGTNTFNGNVKSDNGGVINANANGADAKNVFGKGAEATGAGSQVNGHGNTEVNPIDTTNPQDPNYGKAIAANQGGQVNINNTPEDAGNTTTVNGLISADNKNGEAGQTPSAVNIGGKDVTVNAPTGDDGAALKDADGNPIKAIDATNGGTVSIAPSDKATINGPVAATDKGQVNVSGADVSVSTNPEGKGSLVDSEGKAVPAVDSQGGGVVNINTGDANKGNTTKIDGPVAASGEGSQTNIGGKNVNINPAKGADGQPMADTNAVSAKEQGTVKITGAENNTINGPVKATTAGTVSVDGANNTVNGPVTADENGTVGLNGGNNIVTGDVSADTNGEVNVKGDNNTLKGNVDADNNGKVNVEGANNTVEGNVNADNDGSVSLTGNTPNSNNTVKGDVNANNGGNVNINLPDGGTGTNNITGSLNATGKGAAPDNKNSAINVSGSTILNPTDKSKPAINAQAGGNVSLSYGDNSSINGDINADGDGSDVKIQANKDNNAGIDMTGNVNAINNGKVSIDLSKNSTLKGDLNNNANTPGVQKGNISLNLQGNNVFLNPENGEPGKDDQGNNLNPDAPIKDGITGATWIPNANPEGGRTSSSIDSLSGIGVIEGTNADVNVGSLENPKNSKLPTRIAFETPLASGVKNNGTLNIDKATNTGNDKDNPRVTIVATDYEQAIKDAQANKTLPTVISSNIPESAIDKYVDYNSHIENMHNGLIKNPLVVTKQNGQWVIQDNTNAERSKFASLLSRVAPMAMYGSMTSNMLNDTYNQRMGSALYDPSRVSGPWARTYHDRFGQGGEYRSIVTGLQAGYRNVKETAKGQLIQSYGLQADTHKLDFPTVNGSGKVHGTFLDYYHTNINKDGHYVDISAKIGRIGQKYDVVGRNGTSHGAYHHTAFSTGIEYGYRKDISDKAYIQPQAQLQYTYLSNTNYKVDCAHVHLSALNSLVGRLGFNLGMKTSSSTDAYIRGNIIHEFMASQTITATDKTTGYRPISETMKGRATWYTIGLGVTHNLKDNTRVFADLEKVFGNKYKDSYRLNFGAQFIY